MIPSKPCTKCGQMFALSEFYRCNKRADGLESRCKTCSKRQSRKRYERVVKPQLHSYIHRLWTEAERSQLIELHPTHTAGEIGVILDRSILAVRHQIQALKLGPCKPTKPSPPIEVAELDEVIADVEPAIVAPAVEARPTKATPRSNEKFDIMADRAAMGLPLFHKRDMVGHGSLA